MSGLVLSLFPGIGLLDRAFEESGFCVVRGPDLLWGGDIRRFHPTAGKFDGVIGGPPCQFASPLSDLNRAQGRTIAENLIPDFERVVAAAAPLWFVMENVVSAPPPAIDGFWVQTIVLRDHWCGGETMRKRRFSFGSRDGQSLRVDLPALHRIDAAPAIVSGQRAGRVRAVVSGVDRVVLNRGPRMSLGEMARQQGMPVDFFDGLPFTVKAARQAIANGVPLAMGRVIAAAVSRYVANAAWEIA